MPNACDFSSARPSPLALIDAGFTGVIMYATRFGTSVQDYRTYMGAGLHFTLVMEQGTQPAMRGAQGGRTDLVAAETTAAMLGYPSNATIYYVAEDPVRLSQFDWPTVEQYFAAVKQGNPNRQIGAYGGQALVNYLQGQGLVKYGWGVASWSTSTLGLHLMQELGGVPPNLASQIDLDVILQPDYGQDSGPQPIPPTPPLTREELENMITSWVQGTQSHIAVALVDGNGHPTGQVDHKWFDTTNPTAGWQAQKLPAAP